MSVQFIKVGAVFALLQVKFGKLMQCLHDSTCIQPTNNQLTFATYWYNFSASCSCLSQKPFKYQTALPQHEWNCSCSKNSCLYLIFVVERAQGVQLLAVIRAWESRRRHAENTGITWDVAKAFVPRECASLFYALSVCQAGQAVKRIAVRTQGWVMVADWLTGGLEWNGQLGTATTWIFTGTDVNSRRPPVRVTLTGLFSRSRLSAAVSVCLSVCHSVCLSLRHTLSAVPRHTILAYHKRMAKLTHA